MVGILIVTHGELANAFISSSELIMGKQENLSSLGFYHGENIDALKEEVKKNLLALSQLNENKEVLVLIDMFGGSPSNAVAFSIKELEGKANIECVTGVNLPMLLEVSSQSAFNDLDQLKTIAMQSGNDSVTCLKQKIGM